MRFAPRRLPAVLLLALCPALPGQGRPPAPPAPPPFAGQPLTDAERAARLDRLAAGQSRAQAQALLGPPRRRARQLVYQHVREQWVYDEPLAVRLDFEAAGGAEPRLASPPFQSLRADGR
jgi:hypothetical protein